MTPSCPTRRSSDLGVGNSHNGRGLLAANAALFNSGACWFSIFLKAVFAGFCSGVCCNTMLHSGLGSLSVAANNTVCRSEEHTSELQSLMRLSYAVFCLKKKTMMKQTTT